MDSYVIAPPDGSTNNSIGAADRPWKEGHFEKLPGINEYLAESTGYGIVSGCEPSISGLTVTVAAGVVHLAGGTRKELSATNITLDNADSTNPRIDLVYINADGVVAKVTGTAAASPSAPALPTGGISVAQVNVAAGATTGTVTDSRGMLARYYNTSIINVKDYGAVGDGVTDDTEALKKIFDIGGTIFFPKGTYITSEPLLVHGSTKIIGEQAAIHKKNNGLLSINYPPITSDFGVDNVDLNQVDAVLILSDYKNTITPTTAINELVTGVISNGMYLTSNNYSIGVFGTVFSNCYFRDCKGYNLKYLFKVLRCWLSGIYESYINHAQNAGFDFGDLDKEFITSGGGGTSLRIEDCYVNGASRGFVINNFVYSHLLSCACDGAVNPYRIHSCASMSIRSCACESGNAPAPIMKITNSFPVIVDGCFCYFQNRISETDSTKDTYYYFIIDSSNVKLSYNRIIPKYVAGQLLDSDRTKITNSLCQLESNDFYGLTMERFRHVDFNADGTTISFTTGASFVYQCTGNLVHFSLQLPYSLQQLTDAQLSSQVKIILPINTADPQAQAQPATKALFRLNVYCAMGTQGRVPTASAYYGKVNRNILSLYTDQNLSDANEMKPLSYREMLSGRLAFWALVLEGTYVCAGLY